MKTSSSADPVCEPRPRRLSAPVDGGSDVTSRYRPLNVVAPALTAVTLVLGGCGADGAGSSVDASPSLARTEPPWPAATEGLPERVREAGFPAVGDESYHVHALLSVFVDGDPVLVPANIGIDVERRFMSPLHTHTPDGVLHFEADDPAPFTLGQVFTMWGVEFTPERLGAYTPDESGRVHVYANGTELDEPVDYQIEDGDNIVVAYGETGSLPIEPSDDALRDV